ncbi:tannase and feruloyl esterase [Plenodomus tracheiphilus IPT5]|uniref:Carboxylic ester hydrolase n=1 Tax=Plenodomus tracheiphilus IPT5 TaxID=1408161 RepID=A0A6A7ATX4_9PLEO|nr:tannase and feruloyl esterase [Plenodomus tracheiphilus IPT5]
MHLHYLWLATAPLLGASIVSQHKYKLAARCEHMASRLRIANASSISAKFVLANTTLQFPDSEPTCTRLSQFISVDLCRITLNVSTSGQSGLRMEAWLPANWTGRFLSTGNGGLGGCIQYEDIEYAASLGFAAVGTNNGHDGMTGQSFLNNPDVIEDFAYRALHTGVVVGKQISHQFYMRAHTKSYYLGCSTGGRQGFKSVQDFPDDFDGVVAGAPAFAFNNLTSWSTHFLPLTGVQGDPQFVPSEMWLVIHKDILAHCDSIDGAWDGILESPDLCDYDPTGLLCTPSQNTSCLTSAQVDTVRSIYSPLFGPDGSLVYPRLQPGVEATEAPVSYFLGQAFGAVDWWKYAIFNNPAWNPLTLNPEDYETSSRLNLFNIETWEGDLCKFQGRGGKLLHYHGVADGIIPSGNSARYYEHVSNTMGLRPQELDDFYRYFRISGMAHCGGGPGASFIGNSRRNTASLSPKENVLLATIRWVEEGVAPDTITGTAFVNGTMSAGVDYKRRHCRWPLRNVFDGKGDVKDDSSWQCVV